MDHVENLRAAQRPVRMQDTRRPGSRLPARGPILAAVRRPDLLAGCLKLLLAAVRGAADQQTEERERAHLRQTHRVHPRMSSNTLSTPGFPARSSAATPSLSGITASSSGVGSTIPVASAGMARSKGPQ